MREATKGELTLREQAQAGQISEWVVNGQPAWVELTSDSTIFSLASFAVAQTGNFRYWTPDGWEARCVCGAPLRWSQKWLAAMGDRVRGHYRSGDGGACRRAMRSTVFLNMKPGFGS
jgi:hypothetical protein